MYDLNNAYIFSYWIIRAELISYYIDDDKGFDLQLAVVSIYGKDDRWAVAEMKRSGSLWGKSFNYVRQRATCYLEVWLLSECNYVAFETGSV